MSHVRVEDVLPPRLGMAIDHQTRTALTSIKYNLKESVRMTNFSEKFGSQIKANGPRYIRFLKALHSQYVFDWFLEIGSRNGNSLTTVRSKTIAVDPTFSITKNVTGLKPELHLFQKTSDSFFESKFLEKNGIKVSLAFLDGMHLFEYLLRDFIATERNCASNGIIMLHDCCPWTREMTTRDLDNLPKGPWTGDVFKLIPILQKFRPDLRIHVFDCKPTGLVAVSKLDPGNTVLSEKYHQIVEEYLNVDFSAQQAERLYGSFSYVSANAEAEADFPLFNGLGRIEEVTKHHKVTP